MNSTGVWMKWHKYVYRDCVSKWQVLCTVSSVVLQAVGAAQSVWTSPLFQRRGHSNWTDSTLTRVMSAGNGSWKRGKANLVQVCSHLKSNVIVLVNIIRLIQKLVLCYHLTNIISLIYGMCIISLESFMYFFLVNIGKVKCFIIFLKPTLSGDRFNIFFSKCG